MNPEAGGCVCVSERGCRRSICSGRTAGRENEAIPMAEAIMGWIIGGSAVQEHQHGDGAGAEEGGGGWWLELKQGKQPGAAAVGRTIGRGAVLGRDAGARGLQ